MKKIVFFNSVDSWGGGEKWHFEMATYLNEKQDYEIIVYSQKNSPLAKKVIEKGITVREVKIDNLSFLNPFKILALTKLLRKDSPDLIILNLPKDIKTGAVAAKLVGIENVLYRRGSAIPIKDSFLNRFYFKNVITDMLANSKSTKRTINEKGNLFPLDKIKVIYNGLNLEDYQYQSKQVSSKIIIGNLGRVEYQKNQTALIDLASILKKKDIDFEIIIGGTGRLLDELKVKSKALNVAEYMSFPGYIKDISSFMNQLDVFVLTSHWEGFGYVVTEASLHQKPVLAYNVSSNPEVVIDGQTGFLIEKDDLNRLSNHIIYLSQNRQKIIELGKSGALFVKQNFDANINQQKVEEYFLEIIND